MERSDQELIAAVLGGNQEAFAEIVARYRRTIYSVVHHMAYDPHEANDLFQEAFIRIYQSLDRYESRSKFSTWAVRIATNLCIDRRRRRRDELVAAEDFPDIPDRSENPEEQFINAERTARLRQAIKKLPDKYRIPVILFHQEGLAYEEMAEVLRWPMSMIKNRLYRARLMLRDTLIADGKGESL